MTDDQTPETEWFGLNQIAALMDMSPRWVRRELNDPSKQIEHARPGNKIRMTREQVDKFKALYNKNVTPTRGPITTGRRRS